jgi:hypothetical protein
LDQIQKIASELPASIAHAKVLLLALENESITLKEAGLIHATAYWRQGRYFCLVYPSKPGWPRKIKYVGRDLKKIRASQAAMQRAAEYDDLMARIARLERITSQCCGQLAEVNRMLLDFGTSRPGTFRRGHQNL